MRRSTSVDVESTGYDSFLDIVANLVGILVILIMVLGVRARDAVMVASQQRQRATAPAETTPPLTIASSTEATSTVASHVVPAPPEPAYPRVAAVETLAAPSPAQAAPAPTPPESSHQRIETRLPDVAAAEAKVAALRASIWELDENAKSLSHETNIQRQQRNAIQLLVTLAEKELEQRRTALDESRQSQLDSMREHARLQRDIEEARQQLERTSVEPSEKIDVLKHRPSPMAKTVFDKEEHFYLRDGHLAYVPIGRLEEEFLREPRKKLWKLEHTDELRGTLGPIEGFEMRYLVSRKRRIVQSANGPVPVLSAGLDAGVIVPVQAQLGESVAAALLPNSQFIARLSDWAPGETTVTLWTYPDSFSDFRALKEFLWQRGYATAARPLTEGAFIEISPEGSHSAAQ
ncbi:MAG: hypothetical protein KDA60_12355 [Planctomycetales bacterium]|nr:hypothetical protein [Planctomycetales bacterium]